MTAPAFLGTGWQYPVAPADTGRLEYAAGADKVAQSIWIILDTDPGERIMRPTFGCGLRRHLMSPNTTATRALIKHEVQLALTTLEPRISLSEVLVTPGPDPALVLIRIAYVNVRDNKPGNVVYPFYLE